MFDYLKKRSSDNDKRGQVTIFIILAVLVVGGIVLYFLLSGGSGDSQEVSGNQDVQSPSAFLKSCMEDDVRRTLRRLGVRGGNFDSEDTIRFKFTNDSYTNGYTNISYLCYSASYFDTCNVLDPNFVGGLDEEIEGKVSSKFADCVSNLRDAYEDNGFDVRGPGYKRSNFYSNLSRGELSLGLKDTSWTLDKTNESAEIENIGFSMFTRLHDIAMVSNEIVSQQANYCNFNEHSYTNLYNEYEISRTSAPNSTWIFTVKHINTNDVFRFATRSCVPSPVL
ncbi:MAG: hypothetical protein ABEI74_03275 [Candidatus Pacearchaeota archaeon]